MPIRTKIVATVGPASGESKTIRQLAQAGCDVFRVNFSHGDDEQRAGFLAGIRAAESELGWPLAVMADLCGPKIRVGPIAGGSVLLADGQELVIQREPIEGKADRISTTLHELADAVSRGDAILMDDGSIRMEVVEVRGSDEVVCRIVRGGVLAGSKGVNLPHVRMPIDALTEKDRRDVAHIAAGDFDYVALSFVRSAKDIEALRKLLDAAGCGAHIVAKIEKPQAVDDIDAIIASADAIMVARGDLGVEMPLPEVPIVQKQIARLCLAASKPCIIATEMLVSMTHRPRPTRAEVSDVANAVLDRADAVMLSGETAIGEFPVAAVAMMNEIVARVEVYDDPARVAVQPASSSDRVATALAGEIHEIVRDEGIAAVAVFTATGATALVLAKNRLPVPVLAISPEIHAVRRMCLYYGVDSILADAPKHTPDVLKLASGFCLEHKIARRGDKIVVVPSRAVGKPGATDTLMVHTIG
ncbi:MAG: pyruvate kinase [Planctomycetota bacterium]|nr:pyruvate kinase [Planctomycetota bacterium]